jgi:hypothetical protein
MRILLALMMVLSMGCAAWGEKYSEVLPSGREVVIHTRMAPVMVHRILPPYGLGKHVYVNGRGPFGLEAAVEDRGVSPVPAYPAHPTYPAYPAY